MEGCTPVFEHGHVALEGRVDEAVRGDGFLTGFQCRLVDGKGAGAVWRIDGMLVEKGLLAKYWPTYLTFHRKECWGSYPMIRQPRAIPRTRV